MKEKKNIDRLYQEKFRDFEATPRDAVWKSISAKLQEKKKKKTVVIPMWSRIAGIAAIIALLLLIGDWILQPQENGMVNNEEQIFDEKNEIKPSTEISVTTNNNENEEENIPVEQMEKEAEKKSLTTSESSKRSVSQASSLNSSTIKKTAVPSEKTFIAIAESRGGGDTYSVNLLKKSIFDDLNKSSAEENAGNTAFSSRIEVSTHAAPIYYGNFGKGNFLDSQFDNNSSEGEVTYSYGINVAYAISNKLKIRSGINKVAMSYNTNDIAYHSVANPFAVSSINYRPQDNIVIREAPAGGKGEPVASTRKSSFGNLTTGMLNQKLGYMEVPVELEYKLIDRKFELNLIGGASTLFLNENMISVNSVGLSTNLGEANNLNDVSFSTNVGLGVDYNLTKKFKFNLEPMFKYQINTFNSSSREYQPFYLGIYSGFSFEF